MRTVICSAIVCVACIVPIASAQYTNTATATALGEPDVVDSAVIAGTVEATNGHDTGSFDNPAFGTSNAAGRASLLRVAAGAGAESSTGSSRGSAAATLRATGDVVSFDATEPFTIEVSLDLTWSVARAQAVDDARVSYSANFRRLTAGSPIAIPDRFRFTQAADRPASEDERDAFTVDMLPGDALDVSLCSAVASATAVGVFADPSGSGSAELNAEINIRVIDGDARILAATSGGDYTAEDCAADIAAPFGVLNFFDIAAYITLYNANSPQADIAAPFGALNFFDISAFIAAYNTGCP